MAKPRKRSRAAIDAELALTGDLLVKAEEVVSVIGRNAAVRMLAYVAWRVRGSTNDRDRYIATVSES